MPRFEVYITELPHVVGDPRNHPAGLPAELRNVHWTGEAGDDDAAREAAWHVWDETYGADARPRPAEVIARVTNLDG